MKRKIVIIGASGHGGMLLDCIEKEAKYSVLGFLDSYKEKDSYYSGLQILGNEQDIPKLIEEHDLYGVIVAIGNNWTRKKMVDKLIEITPDLNFVSTIHPSAVISRNVQIGKGTVIMPSAIVNSNSKIGDFCILNTNSSLGHDGTMEDYSSISSGVCTGGNLMLGGFSAISLGANVIENINIGTHSVVGAGAMVVKDVEEKTVVYGAPARFIRHRDMEDPYLKGDRCPPQLNGQLNIKRLP
ncbi:acetyltransferase [Gelidibacter salicanalis]|uniref:Acetyltransferase n=1 Tax=Gelidibacter salicanalis TaxID=291193 RepID=A0A934KXA9_9FLAO|nr:acetyltransferase [Gelidibacter salicanalis]MBJ7881020.1 acetyltransferase [Gelidibacter salicanalis]